MGHMLRTLGELREEASGWARKGRLPMGGKNTAWISKMNRIWSNKEEQKGYSPIRGDK